MKKIVLMFAMALYMSVVFGQTATIRLEMPETLPAIGEDFYVGVWLDELTYTDPSILSFNFRWDYDPLVLTPLEGPSVWGSIQNFTFNINQMFTDNIFFVQGANNNESGILIVYYSGILTGGGDPSDYGFVNGAPGTFKFFDLKFTYQGGYPNIGWDTSETEMEAPDGETYALTLLITNLPEPPHLTVTPESYDYGLAEVYGTPTSYTFKLENDGGYGAQGSIQDIIIPDGSFWTEIIGTIYHNFDLQPGESIFFNVYFSPAGPGNYNEILTIYADHPCNDQTIQLAGEGFAYIGVSTGVSPPEGGVTTGDGYYMPNSQACINAIPNPGFIFDYWEEVNWEPGIVYQQANHCFDVDYVGYYWMDEYYWIAHFHPEPPHLIISPESYDFGLAEVYGTPANCTFELTNDGISEAHGYIQDICQPICSYYLENNGKSDIDFVLQPGESLFFDVMFAPISPNTHEETLMIYGDDACNNVSVQLTGEGFLYIGVNTSAFPPEGGITSGDGYYMPNNTACINAIPNPGFMFDFWELNLEPGNIYQDANHCFDVNHMGGFLPDEYFWTAYFQPNVGGGFVDLDVKVFLEGPFGGAEMTNDLYGSGLIPLNQPYNISPWYYPGTENVPSLLNPDIIDWILLEVRQATGGPNNALPNSVVERKAAFLLNNGQVVGMDGANLPVFNLLASNNYYLVIWHRNHLPIMSSIPLTESMETYTYDFTDQLSKAYEDGQKEIAVGVFGMIGGDCDANGVIEIRDKNICWADAAGKMGYIPGDWDLNTQVNNHDKNDIWAENLGMSTMIPSEEVYNPATGRIWMDRNLGALQVATSSDDALAYGGLYQWGRFSEGHEIRTSGTTSTTAFTPAPNDGNTWDGLFITGSDDWLNSPDNTLWQGVNSNNNPCPSGFRLPIKEEWEAEMASWSSPNAAGAFDSPLKLTVAGYRSSGDASLKRVGTRGYYMSSTINEASTSIWRLRIANDAYISTNYRATGFSVRCIKSQPPEPPTDPIPMDGSTEVGTNTNINWTCTNPNDYKYNVYFGMDSNPPFVADNLDETSFDPGYLDFSTTYYWKVIAFNYQGDSAVSDIWIFKTVDDPFQNCGDILLDSRDGKMYTTVQIGDQCWMAENLNVGNRVDVTFDQMDNGIIEKYCYDDNEDNCDVYGGLYQWEEIINHQYEDPGIKGICPDGWHIPTDSEWRYLEGTADTQYGVGDPIWLDGECRGLDGGGSLKEIGFSHWDSPNTGATNSSGFTSLPGGLYDEDEDDFYGMTEIGVYWTSSYIYNPDYDGIATHYQISEEEQACAIYIPESIYSLSLRCLKYVDNSNQAPNQPELPTPQNGSQIQFMNSIDLDWNCIDPDGDPLVYDIFFDTEPEPDIIFSGLTETSVIVDELSENTTYYWKVRVQDDHGNIIDGPVWNFTTSEQLDIGDYMYGGVVFYLDGNGGGLVCAIDDQGLTDWGCYYTAINGADGTAIGTGVQNTMDIINGCTSSGFAAELCSSLSLNGYTDWFLPSKDELNEMFQNKASINITALANGGSDLSWIYWSSSEVNGAYAWIQEFNDGIQAEWAKDDWNSVRAVRAF